MRFVREQSQQSVVQVLDPQVYLRHVKKDLSEKQGLPAEHQRLTFTVATTVERAVVAPSLPASAESLLSELHTWQALVYHNKRCLGRFVKPRLYSVAQVDEASRATTSESCPVQQLSITYDCFQAASSGSPSRVCVPLVTASSSEQYRFTVVGHCEQQNFVLPATYQFSGQQAAYALQKALYTSKHLQSQGASSGAVAALSPLITTSDLSVTFGAGLELFSAVFEPQADSAWLKCLVLKFCLVAESSLHEAGPTLSESESSVSITSGQTQFTKPKSEQRKTLQSQASSTMPPSNKSVSKNKKQKQASRSSAAAKSKSDTQNSLKNPSREDQLPQVQQQQASEQPETHAHKAMAVPVTSEDHKATVNSLSKRGALDAASTGTPANGWTQTESSSVAGTSEDAVSSWQHAAAKQPSTLSEPAADNAAEMQSVISDSVSQPQPGSARASARSSQADLLLPNGWHDDASANGRAPSHQSVGSAPKMPLHGSHTRAGLLQGGHGNHHAPGMYAVPEAVHAWATDGAASASPVMDADANQPLPHRQSQRSSQQPNTPYINGYAPGTSQAHQPHVKLGSLYPNLANAGYSDSPSSSNHWQASSANPPAGLSQLTGHQGWSNSDVHPAQRQATSGQDQPSAANQGLPSYALSAYYRQPHAQPPGPGYPGHAQHRHQGSSAPNARLTSSLQSLDLAHDSWHNLRPGQDQRLSRGGRPAAHGAATQPPSARVSPERPRDTYSDTGAHPHAGLGHRSQRPASGVRHAAYPMQQHLPGGQYSGGNARHHDDCHCQGMMSFDAGEAAMLASAGQLSGAYQDPRSLLPDWQKPAPLRTRDLAAATDLERLVQQLTPVLSHEEQGNGKLTLGDLWQWYLEPSLYGTEVLTMGGSRGPSVSYFVPYLSAMQLLLPVQPQPAAAQQQGPAGKQSEVSAPAANQAQQQQEQPPSDDVSGPEASLPQQGGAASSSLPRSGKTYQVHGSWQDGSAQVQPLVEHFDTELPFNRVPMHDKVQELAADRLSSCLPGSLLNEQLLAELHPASWYAVAWYPAYRIPDAPLNGRFLTFHHLTPQRGATSSQPPSSTDELRAIPDSSAKGKANESAAGERVQKMEMPIAGLKFCNLHGERWLEPLTMDSVADNKATMHGSQLRNSNRGNSSAPQHLQQHISSLQQHAEYLARGYGLRLMSKNGLDRLQQRHPDFEFFHTRP